MKEIKAENLIYRKTDENDIPQLIEMRMAYINSDMGELTTAQESAIRGQLPDYFKRNLNKNLLAFVCRNEETEEIVSTVLMLITEKPANPHFLTGKMGTMLNVYTKPLYRRKGIGSKLVQMAISEGKERNLSFIDLHATAEGYYLYKANGFIEDKTKYCNMKFNFDIKK